MFTLDNYKVKFRYSYEFRGKDKSPKPVDTYCTILSTTSDEVVSVGIARCSKADNPDKNIGRKLAFQRALSKLFPEDRDLRRKFWQKYFECTKA